MLLCCMTTKSLIENVFIGPCKSSITHRRTIEGTVERAVVVLYLFAEEIRFMKSVHLVKAIALAK